MHVFLLWLRRRKTPTTSTTQPRVPSRVQTVATSYALQPMQYAAALPQVIAYPQHLRTQVQPLTSVAYPIAPSSGYSVVLQYPDDNSTNVQPEKPQVARVLSSGSRQLPAGASIAVASPPIVVLSAVPGLQQAPQFPVLAAVLPHVRLNGTTVKRS